MYPPKTRIGRWSSDEPLSSKYASSTSTIPEQNEGRPEAFRSSVVSLGFADPEMGVILHLFLLVLALFVWDSVFSGKLNQYRKNGRVGTKPAPGANNSARDGAGSPDG
jgi:hypothetical protein